jgi:glycosyltransferase involved in cell wall biosynthesis
LRRLIAFTHTQDDPASRFRFKQYIPYLEQAGWKVSLRTNQPPRPWQSPFHHSVLKTFHQRAGLLLRRVNRLRDIYDASSFDVVFVNRDLLEGNVRYEKFLMRQNPRVIFDFDDAIFLDGKADHIGWICRNAAWVTAGNEYLAHFATRFTDKVTVLPTVVEAENYLLKQDFSNPGPFRIGWCGSDRSIEQTLFPYIEMFARLQTRLGFEFVVMTKPRPVLPASSLRWDYVEWSETDETRIASYFDVGIMPLTDEEYQKGKCGCKILQYMAAGLPAVVSPVGINSKLVEHGERGFLADTEEEWFVAIRTLMSDPILRQKFGLTGREFVEREYSLRVWVPVLLELLRRVSGGQ